MVLVCVKCVLNGSNAPQVSSLHFVGEFICAGSCAKWVVEVGPVFVAGFFED